MDPVFDRLSTDDVATAIDELVASLGVKEDRVHWDLLTLLGNKDTQACVQGIASQLGLPVRIHLTYVPNGPKPTENRQFQSSSLSRTDSTGRGIDAITAQVCLPDSLPIFGSPSLTEYPIAVRVSENCCEQGASFIAVMAHELSHVLLRSLCHPRQESELHTDLVPILLGFRGSVREGRKYTTYLNRDGRSRVETTTYGYLTDEQFEFAYAKTGEILHKHTEEKMRILGLEKSAQLKLCQAKVNLGDFLDYLGHLDKSLTRKIKRQDAHRLVQFHSWNYTGDWANSIAFAEQELKSICAFTRTLNHYTSNTIERLRGCERRLQSIMETLVQMTKSIAPDLKVAKRNASLVFRLKRALRRSQLRAGHLVVKSSRA